MQYIITVTSPFNVGTINTFDDIWSNASEFSAVEIITSVRGTTSTLTSGHNLHTVIVNYSQLNIHEATSTYFFVRPSVVIVSSLGARCSSDYLFSNMKKSICFFLKHQIVRRPWLKLHENVKIGIINILHKKKYIKMAVSIDTHLQKVCRSQEAKQ